MLPTQLHSGRTTRISVAAGGPLKGSTATASGLIRRTALGDIGNRVKNQNITFSKDTIRKPFDASSKKLFVSSNKLSVHSNEALKTTTASDFLVPAAFKESITTNREANTVELPNTKMIPLETKPVGYVQKGTSGAMLKEMTDDNEPIESEPPEEDSYPYRGNFDHIWPMDMRASNFKPTDFDRILLSALGLEKDHSDKISVD
uniref:Uncharacterized protein n=1 Tax=Romanomermis culicivorax TaxID=13658 RepID=A0A915KPC2_ROMCU